MSIPHENNTFEERLEAYLDGTLSAEEARNLLQELEADPELSRKFCDQVRTARLVDAKSNPSTTEVQHEVMKRLRKTTRGKSGWRLLSGPLIFRVAAALVLGAILAGMFLPSLSQPREKARRVSKRSIEKMEELQRRVTAYEGRRSPRADALPPKLFEVSESETVPPDKPRGRHDISGESYAEIVENTFMAVREAPLGCLSERTGFRHGQHPGLQNGASGQ